MIALLDLKPIKKTPLHTEKSAAENSEREKKGKRYYVLKGIISIAHQSSQCQIFTEVTGEEKRRGASKRGDVVQIGEGEYTPWKRPSHMVQKNREVLGTKQGLSKKILI